MPTYPTPDPISTSIQLACGDVRIEASDRVDTVVDVTPSNGSRDADVTAAQQTRVEHSDGTVRVIGAKGRGFGLLRTPGAVRVLIKVPSGSHVDAGTGLGRVSAVGDLGECRIRSGAGDIDLSEARAIDVVTGLGAISAGHVSGDATCITGSGSVRVTQVDGTTRVKNSNGDTWLGDVRAAVTVKSSNGSIRVDQARGDVKAATANGDVSVGSAEHGAVDLKTALGRIEVGVAAGTAAHLDLHTSFGSVVNELEAADRPRADESTLTMSAQTSAGDIVIRRAVSHE